MNNVVLNIVSKKENLSYPLIFRKIANYYWNSKQYCKFTDCSRKCGYCVFRYGCLNTVKKIIRKHDLTDDLYNRIELATYSTKEPFEIVKYLFENKIGTNGNIQFLGSPLSIACWIGHFELVKYFVEVIKADIHFAHESPLAYACITGKLEIIKYLLKKGAIINNHVINRVDYDKYHYPHIREFIHESIS